MSGFARDEVLAHIGEQEVFAVLQKPFTHSDLIDVVRGAMLLGE